MPKLRKEDGYWKIVYYDPKLGRTRRSTTKLTATSENKPAAKQKMKEFLAEFEARDNPQKMSLLKGYMRFSQGLEEYNKKNKISEGTKKLNNYVTKYLYDCLGDLPISEYEHRSISAKIIKFFENKGLSNNSIAIYLNQLHAIFGYFVKNKYISSNPIETRDKEDKEVIIIPPDHKQKILDELKSRTKRFPQQYRIINFMFLTGARVSDAIALHRQHILFNEGVIRITNKKKNRIYEFPLTSDLRDLFISHKRKPEESEFGYKTKDSLRFFNRVCEKLKLPEYTLHNIRKTFNSELWKKGVSVEDRAKLLNQYSLETNKNNYTLYDLVRYKDILEDTKMAPAANGIKTPGTNPELNKDELEQLKTLLEKFLKSTT